MFGLISVCLITAAPMLEPPKWAWAQIERDQLIVEGPYDRADLPRPFVRYYGGIFFWRGFKLDDVRIYYKNGTERGVKWLRDRTNPLRGPFYFGIDVVVCVGVMPPAERLNHVSDDTPIIVLPRTFTHAAISFD